GAAEAGYGREIVDGLAVSSLDEIAIARILSAQGDLFHRPIERALFPVIGIRRPVHYASHAMRIHGQLKRVRAFRAEGSLIDRTVVVALYVDDLAALDVNDLPAADGAVGTDAGNADGASNARSLGQRIGTDGLIRDLPSIRSCCCASIQIEELSHC